MYQSQEAWVDILTEIGAFWYYDYKSDPRRPHALLSSGRHSDGYFNRELLIQEGLLHSMCADTIEKIQEVREINPNIVIGCGIGAKLIAKKFADLLGQPCCGFAQKIIEHDTEKMTLGNSARMMERGMRVLLVDDVVTTFGTIEKTAEAVREYGATVTQEVLVLLNRSGQWKCGKQVIFSLLDCEMETWTRDDCPLCAKGSPAIVPRESWKELTFHENGEGK